MALLKKIDETAINFKKIKNDLNKLIEILKENGLTVDEKDKYKLIWYLETYGYETIITNYSDFFLHTYDKEKNKFIYGSNCVSFIELFNFDRTISKDILVDILNIEKRFANSLTLFINFYINDHLIHNSSCEKKNSFFINKYSINDFVKSNDMKNIFLKLFKKHHAKDKKIFCQFIEHIIKNKLVNSNETLMLVFDSFCDSLPNYNNKSSQLITIFQKIFSIKDMDSKIKDNIDLVNVINDKNWLESFNILFQEFCFNDITNLMLSQFKKESEKEKNKNTPISDISKKWTLGIFIKIFESLESKIKNQIINYMFNKNNINWIDSSKKLESEVPTFIEIMRMLKEVRNRSCHNEPIFNFKYKTQGAKLIIDFLSINYDEYGNKMDYFNEVNLTVVASCLKLFDTFKNRDPITEGTRIKERIMNYSKFSINILPENAKTHLKKLKIKCWK